ncbi:MAG: GDYXXLXY domain-containing protein [Cyanobacteria bacterium CRU_2_1]|nr:GDYXXLXY domain-containing protein [Cyanobacteria bacterium RU_5_0]NJR62429.1 GDYXXLXY domain-containing protein [Cyanobacteria bacterium CRU_2_1]
MTRIPPNIPSKPPYPETKTLPGFITAHRHLPGWRLWLPLLFQALIIVAVPARDAYTYVAGKPITLQTAPVDPYDLLRGYYQTLNYDISNPTTLNGLPGGNWFDQMTGKTGSVYVVLQAPDRTDAIPPQPWTPVRVSADRPTDLAPNQVALQGHYNGWQIEYGLETYYLPEDQRTQINSDILQVQLDRQTFVVDVKVDEGGNAVPTGLWVSDRNYRF